MAPFGRKLLRTMLRAGCGIVVLTITARADDQTFQRASISFIKTYFQQWSSSNTAALSYMDVVFPDRVRYFDKTLDHGALMDAKRRFVLRWPERYFKERPDSLKVTCDAQHLCTVWGLVDWECRNPQSHKSATGTSAFSLQLQDGMAVVAENGFVVSRGQALAPDLPEVTAAASKAPKPPAPQTPVPEAVKTPVPEAPRTLVPEAIKTPVPPAPQTSVPEAVKTPVPEAVVSQPVPPAAQDVARASPDSHTGSYTNGDIPTLRAAYFSQSSDHDWVGHWLMAEKKFTGTARSLGSAGVYALSDGSGDEVHVMQFEAEQGPIACMVADQVPTFAKGAEVRIEGTVSIFIDQTMYLAHCSFN